MDTDSVIRELPPEIIDQIAAGEVVERPASVVKELVENALDAQATNIGIEIESGGKRLIRVVDNGVGMSEADLRLAVKRHATSKLKSIDDLFGISTMGFRGEALSSIASVARVRIASRPRGSEEGTELTIEGGAIVDCRPVGVPVGTLVEVKDLMFNVPARQKFLKGDATETSHINDAVNRLALAHPAVHFRLRHGSRTTVQAPLHRSQLERAKAVLGNRVGRNLIPGIGEERGIKVQVFLAAPELAQTTSRGLQLFVGRRPVKDRGLLHAVNLGYGELVPKGRYPVAVVFVDVPDPEVDVNVHPQKLEVRFSDPQAVYAAVRHTVARTVAEASWLQHEQAQGPAPVRMRVFANREGAAVGSGASTMAHSYAGERTRQLFGWGRQRRASPVIAREQVAEGSAPMQAPQSAPATADARPKTSDAFFSGLRYIGQLDRTYLIAEAAGELVLVDQHAAHERVAFDRLKRRFADQSVPVQRLLFARNLEFTEAEGAVVGECLDDLAKVGFELEHFGGKTWAVKAVPAELRVRDPLEVLKTLVSDLADHGSSRAVEERLDTVLATIACHSVVRAGDSLSPREVEALFVAMDGIDLSGYCPHGRPVLLRMSLAEIARRFGRS
jgi:DNA mismatch repair protein MutL